MKMIAVSKRVAYVYILIVFALCFLFYPITMDDYWLLYDFKKGFTSVEGGSVIEGLKSFWISRVYYDTARLSNFLCLPFLLMPRWITALLSYLCVLLTMCLICRLGRVRKDDYGGITLVFLFITFCLPWHDSLFTGAYAANYWWETPLMLFMMTLFLGETRRNCVLTFFLGVLLGGWHEIFGVPMLAGSAALLVLGLVGWRRDRVLMCVGLLVGLSLLFFAPAMRYRLPNETTHTVTLVNFVQLVYHVQGFWLLTVLWLVCLARKKWRRIAVSPLPVFAMIACTSIIVVQFLVVKARAGFPAYILAYTGIIYILVKIAPEFIRGKALRYAWIWWLGLVCMIVHLTAACISIYDMSRERAAIREVYLANVKRPVTIFADLTFDRDQPFITLKKGFYEKHSHGWHFRCYHEWAGVPFHHIVPSELKDYEAGMGTPVAGNAGASLYKDFLVMPFRPQLDPDKLNQDLNLVLVDYGGNLRHADIALFRGADGKYYYFVNPYNRTWEFWSKPDAVVLPFEK